MRTHSVEVTKPSCGSDIALINILCHYYYSVERYKIPVDLVG